MIRHERHAVLAVLGLVIAFGLPELGLAKLVFGGTIVGARIGHELIMIAIAAILLGWVLRVERLPLTSIGLRRPTRATLGWGLAATAFLMATVMLSYAVIIPALGLKQNMAATSAVVKVPLWLFLVTPVVAGITEEIIYRGYAIERLSLLLGGRRWIAGVVAGGMFLLAHLGWGAAQLIVVGFATVTLVVLYLWRRDLPCVMIAHASTDLIGFTLARLQT